MSSILPSYFTVQTLTSFEGRLPRMPYFISILLLGLVGGFLMIVGNILGSDMELMYILINLALLYPNLAIAAKRCHDFGKSGWLLLLYIIPLVNFIFILVLLFKRGDTGPNEYGLPLFQ